MESTVKNPLSKKALFETVNLIESFSLFQNNDSAKQLRNHTAQLNNLIDSSSREK